MSTQEPAGAKQGTENRSGVKKNREDWGLRPTRGHMELWPIVVMREYGPSVARAQPFQKKPEIQILM